MILLIISHTEHYKNAKGDVIGWGPTIREVNYLAQHFDKIYHCAPLLETNQVPPSSLLYEYPNIEFVPLVPSGGKGVSAKLNVLWQARKNIKIVSEIIPKVDYFQFRAPTGMGVYMIPWLFLERTKGWFKYAGNWAQKNPPLGYAIQRWLLKNQSKYKVTINGRWAGQPAHCITFENPCLTNLETEEGIAILNRKDYSGQLNFCFVGRLESAKGVGRILRAFSQLKDHSKIGVIHLVGDGVERSKFELIAKDIPLDIRFHGFVERNKVAEIMKDCHVFLLPSTASEGFPKVIAEAANYGCIPIVSDVSSIGQYIKHLDNGFLVSHKDEEGLEFINVIQDINFNQNLKEIALRAQKISSRFTFEWYLNLIETKILNS